MGPTISFIIVVIVVVAIIFMGGFICMQNSERVRESFNASNVLKNFVNNEGMLEQQIDVKGEAGLDFLGTFVIVQGEQDTVPTLIDEIVVVDNWQCPDGEEGVCTG